MDTQSAAPQFEGQIRVTTCTINPRVLLVDVAYQEQPGKLAWAEVPPQSAMHGQCRAEFQHQQKLARLLRKRCRQIIRRGAEVLPVETATALKSATDLANIFGCLRGYAAEFVVAGLSTSYWNVIDAVSFFLDATTASWPLMTLDDRHRLLTWSEEMAAHRV